MPDTPLNPDALEAAGQALWERMSDPLERKVYAFTDAPSVMPYSNHARAAVSAYLASALPEVTSVEELHHLPSGSIVRASGGSAWKKFGSGCGAWFKAGDSLDYEASIVALPARVLYRPEVNDA